MCCLVPVSRHPISGFLVSEFDLPLVGVTREWSIMTLIVSFPFVDLELSKSAAVVAPMSTDDVFTDISRDSPSNGEAGRLNSVGAVCDCDEDCCCSEADRLEAGGGSSGDSACGVVAGCLPGLFEHSGVERRFVLWKVFSSIL